MRRRKHTSSNRITRSVTQFYRRRFTRRHVIIIFAVAVIGTCGLTLYETLHVLTGKHTVATPGWIIDGPQLQSFVGYAPSSLPQRYFDTTNTIVMRDRTGAHSDVPSGWSSEAGNHYTAYGTQGCTVSVGCYSLMGDLNASKKHNIDIAPIALYDNESWAQTPAIEQTSPCSYMSKFVTTAHAHGIETIVAPDQDLAEPGIITSYQGGESENWQAYLRLGLAACAAKTGSEWYHVMSQPFESNWCSNPFEECQSSESDFDNFVTQAVLQAKAVNASIKISDGLSTNPDYFGYFRGAQAFARAIYQDYIDTRPMVDAVWMNILGRNGNLTALYFTSLLSKGSHARPNSSVWFLQPNNLLRNSQSSNSPTRTFSLGTPGSSLLFTSNQTLQSKTHIPAGTGDFQFWTDGPATSTAQVNVTFGYCKGSKCTNRSIIQSMNVQVSGSAEGATAASGAYTTASDIFLPSQGPYHLYVQLTVVQGASFNLLYGDNTPTNLSSSVVLPVN